MMRAVSRGSLLRRRIALAGGLLLLAFTASAVMDAWRSYRGALVAIDRELGNLSRALAEEASSTFQAVDVVMSEVAKWQAANGGKIAREAGDAALLQFETGAPLAGLAVTDAQGSALFQSQPFPDGGLAAPSGGLVGGGDRPMVALSRDIEHDGRPAGRVTALVDLAAFQQLYDTMELGSEERIALLRDDGTLLARRPHAVGSVGRKYALAAAAQDLRPPPGAPPTAVTDPRDGREWFVAVSRVPDFPFLVMAARDSTAALAAWREQTTHSALRTGLLVLLGAALIAGLVRQLARTEAADQAVREQAALLDLTRDMVFVRDASGVITYWNHGAEDAYGWTRAEAIGRRAHELLQTEYPVPVADIDAALERTGHWEGELVHRRRDGTPIVVASRWAVQRGEHGQPRAILETNNDITARRNAEADKARLEGELRRSQKMEAIGTLAGGIAHDFNNILGAILGYGELAQRKAGESGPLREYVDQVMQAGNRGKHLVEHILAFSRSGVGERLPVHVQSVVEETLDLLAASLPPAIRLEKNLRGGDAAIVGDATQLHQVVMNLCTNAVQAMPDGGVLTITLERTDLAEARELSHGTLSPGPYVRLQVGDTGTGIPPDVLERIFDPFFTTKGVGQGTGLGLSLVHGTVADFGGAVDVATRTGAGTTFTVWLPAAGDAPALAVDAAGRLPHGNGEAVMIVDDEPALVTIAEEVLAGLGYEPVGFTSSTAALASFRTGPDRYDAVLTDETMPDVTGTELAREMRRMRPDLPIILMSGYSGPQLAERAHEAGVGDLLRKPLVSRDIAEALARAIRARD